ncbi:MAG: hypothetical protein Q9226_005997 [Calogaya cf. arnoldii]
MQSPEKSPKKIDSNHLITTLSADKTCKPQVRTMQARTPLPSLLPPTKQNTTILHVDLSSDSFATALF